MPIRHLLAIPVFNEEKHVLNVLREASRYSPEVLVVDDGSTDATAAILRRQRGLHVITHPENRGYGKSLADSFAFARRHGYDWLITMDCDEQHEPSHIPLFLAAAARDHADIISGTRYPGGHDESAAPPDRREINRIITAMVNHRLGLDITDAFCGFKAYRVRSLAHLCITVPGYAVPMQMWVQIARAGLRVHELPVRLIYNDPTRHFGGLLDDPEVRLRHYRNVFDSELKSANAVPCLPDVCGSGNSCSTFRD
jgi:dolichol-phosphate mannosyltransferase